MTTPNPAAGRLLCVGLTTVDVVALAVQLERFEGVRLISAMQIAPAGTAAGAALVAARLGVSTQLLGTAGANAMGRFVCNELAFAGVDVSLMKVMPGKTTSATLIPIDPAGERSDIDFALGAAEASFETLKAKRASLGPVQKLQALFASFAEAAH